MLAVLSALVTDQSQQWALVPAVFMGLSGLVLMRPAARGAACSMGSGHRPSWPWRFGWSSEYVDSCEAGPAGCSTPWSPYWCSLQSAVAPRP